jgi:hypothetical protein
MTLHLLSLSLGSRAELTQPDQKAALTQKLCPCHLRRDGAQAQRCRQELQIKSNTATGDLRRPLNLYIVVRAAALSCWDRSALDAHRPKMSRPPSGHGADDNELHTYSSGYLTFTSDPREENQTTLPDRYHHDFITFLSVAQQLEIDFMSINWQPALSGLGIGGSSDVMQSNMISKDLAFAFKRTKPKMADKKRFRALLCEVLALRASGVQNYPKINQLEGIAWDIQGSVVWPVLVFSKANLGSLKQFAEGPRWAEASFEDKIRLCTDVALGLRRLHISSLLPLLHAGRHATKLNSDRYRAW